jgi:hypothetical protein
MTFCGVFRAYLAAEKEFDFLAGRFISMIISSFAFLTQRGGSGCNSWKSGLSGEQKYYSLSLFSVIFHTGLWREDKMQK